MAKPAKTIEVVKYETTPGYNRDAQRRAAAGWTVAAQTQDKSHRRVAASTALAVGTCGVSMLAPAWRKSGAITVTWVRDQATADAAQAAKVAAVNARVAGWTAKTNAFTEGQVKTAEQHASADGLWSRYSTAVNRHSRNPEIRKAAGR